MFLCISIFFAAFFNAEKQAKISEDTGGPEFIFQYIAAPPETDETINPTVGK